MDELDLLMYEVLFGVPYEDGNEDEDDTNADA